MIVANIMTKQGSLDNVITYEHYCDTVADLSNIPLSQTTLGSVAIVVNDEDDGMGIYIANSQKEWTPISTSISGSGSGEVLLDLIHVCSSSEYDSVTKVPTIEDAESNKIYLVPNSESGNNAFDEWIYANEAWERFGGGSINIPVTDVQVNGVSVLDAQGVANVDSVIVAGTGIRSAKLKDGDGEAIGGYSFAEGASSYALGNYSHAEGQVLLAMSESSHAEGTGATNEACYISDTDNNKQYIITAPSVPSSTDFTPYILHTIVTVNRIDYGFITKVDKTNDTYLITVDKSIGTGYNNTHCHLYFAYAMGKASHKEGGFTASTADYQHVQGHLNAIDVEKQYADIVGNGSNLDVENRSNAYALTWTGDGKYAGDVYVHANTDSSGGTKLATVNDVTVTDVQVNGTSVVSNGVAEIPIGKTNILGVVKYDVQNGVEILSDGTLKTVNSYPALIKAGVDSKRPHTSNVSDSVVFYGLAKAAGANMASISSTTLGVYPAAQKAAIQSMLGIDLSSIAQQVEIPLVETVTGTTPTITGQPNVRYVCGEVTSITITPPSAGSIDVIFTSGSSPAVLTLPSTVSMPVWFDSTVLDANTKYEILITDGEYGSVMSWPI